MRILLLVLFFYATAGCSRARPVTNLTLTWRGESLPHPNAEVSRALNAAPVALFVRDARSAPTEVGFDERNARPIYASGDVATWCADVARSVFEGGGARIDPSAATQITLQFEALRVVEGGMFNGEALVRVSVTRGGVTTLNDVYSGKSKRWGRTHNPDNMNEAITSALSVALKRLLTDRQFAVALGGDAPANVPPPLPTRGL
ncbi:MAG: hypothetical protein INH41_12360 [Myxococcaceae bacterium]|jgi:hypothetical protein|nr:hypothetical protein [Myxococcaceae bacterium]